MGFVGGIRNNDDIPNLEPTPEPNKEEIYKSSTNYNILDQKYYRGSDGKEYTSEADVFFKKQWSFYNDPSIKTVQIKNDSIIINENLVIQKFKFIKDGNNILIKDEGKNVLLGYTDSSKKNLNIVSFPKISVIYNYSL